MTIPEISTEARAALIKKALMTPSTCNSSTVTSLEWLLNCPREPRSTTPASFDKVQKSKITASVKTVIPTKTPKIAKAKTTTKITEVDVSEENAPEPTAQERQKLATEVFNLSLRALSEEIKIPTNSPSNQACQVGKQRRTPPAWSRTASGSSQPLQILSPNRLPRSPAHPTTTKGTPSSANGVLSGRIAIAECARIALSALRTIRGPKIKEATADLQLEHGTCALVGKFLQLGLNDLALKELRVLRRRIDGLLGRKEDNVSTKRPTKTVPEGKEGVHRGHASTLLDLLRFDNVAADGSLLCLMITFQGFVLKLILTDKKPLLLEGMVSYLDPSTPDSPSDLILRSLSGKAQSSEKAVQRLRSLALSVWSIASSPPVSKDGPDSSPTGSRTIALFRLQIISFEIRAQWWKVSGHDVDVESELWTPFSRCLSDFTRHISSPTTNDYLLSKDALSRLQTAEKALNALTKGNSKANQAILKSLANFALQTGHRTDAAGFLEQSAKVPKSDGNSGVLWCMRQCEIASLHLDKTSKSKVIEALPAMENATKGLQGDLRASTSDFDALFFQAANLNKLVVRCIPDRVDASNKSSADLRECENVKSSLTAFTKTFYPFLVRYLGEPPQEQDEKAVNRFEERIDRSRRIAISAINRAIGLAKSSVVSGCPLWEVVESILADCAMVADRLESERLSDAEDSSVNTPTAKPSSHVNLSNAYWMRYLHDKEIGSEPRQLWRSLRTSVALIRDRPLSEKIAGFAGIKLERLAATYTSLHRTHEAKESFEEAVRFYVSFGVLESLSSEAKFLSLQSTRTEESKHVSAFRRLLSSFIEFTHNQSRQFPGYFYDDAALPTEQRGILLETHTQTTLEFLKTSAFPTSDSLRNLVETILTVYDRAMYPLRRLRVILRIVRFSSDGTGVVDSSLTAKLFAEICNEHIPDDGYSNDADLEPYAKYFEGARIVCAFFHGDQTRPEVLDKAISLWSTLPMGDTEELESHVESVPELVKQLELVVDYLDMQGRWFSKIRSLDLLSRLYELEQTNNPASLGNVFSRLGLQFSRLGYSGKAGNLLAKAESYVEKGQINLTVKLRWHLAYAEYLLEIGNTEKW
jgi:separase